MKTGKEIKTNIFKNYSVSFGSVNNKNGKSVYINISSWIEPTDDDRLTYNRCVKNIHKKIRQHVYNFLSDKEPFFLKDYTIIDLDIRESGIRYGKRSFMSCEITLFSDFEIQVNDDEVREKINQIYSSIIKNIFESNNDFTFNKKKK